MTHPADIAEEANSFQRSGKTSGILLFMDLLRGNSKVEKNTCGVPREHVPVHKSHKHIPHRKKHCFRSYRCTGMSKETSLYAEVGSKSPYVYNK